MAYNSFLSRKVSDESFARQLAFREKFDLDYLKNKYSMYPVATGDLSYINWKEHDSNNYLVTVYQFYKEGRKDNDRGTCESIYFATEDQDLLKKVSGLKDQVAIDHFFMPIFRDLALNADFKDPYQVRYNEKVLKKVELLINSIDVVDQSNWSSQLPINRHRYSFKYTAPSSTYFLKSTDDIDIKLEVWFDPKLISGASITLEVGPYFENFHTYSRKNLLNGDAIRIAILEGLKAYWEEVEDIKKRIGILLSEFPFLTKSSENRESCWVELKNAYRFPCPRNPSEKITAYEIYNDIQHPNIQKYNFANPLTERYAKVFTDRDDAFNRYKVFENYKEIKSWLSSPEAQKPFIDYFAKIQMYDEELKVGQLAKFKLLKTLELPKYAIKLRIESAEIYGVEEKDCLCIYHDTEKLEAIKWKASWNLISEDSFTQVIQSYLKKHIAQIAKK